MPWIEFASDSKFSSIKSGNKAFSAGIEKADIAPTEKASNNNIGTKRPGTGISPINWESVIGQVSKDNFEQDELIRLWEKFVS